MVTQATDIHMDSSCSKTTDTDMAFCRNLVWDMTMAPVAVQATHINMALLAACPSDQVAAQTQASAWPSMVT